MEPLTTVALSTIVGYLAKKLKDNKSVQDFFDDFTEASVNWIKPLFIREDGSPEKVLKDLQEKPDSVARQEAAKSSIAIALEDNPHAATLLQEMLKVIQQKDPSGFTGKTINQYHTGSGDNFGGDQINYHK